MIGILELLEYICNRKSTSRVDLAGWFVVEWFGWQLIEKFRL